MWHDEFESGEDVTDNWTFESYSGSYNNELQHYLPSATYSPTGESVASISNGVLHITGRKVTPSAASDQKSYVSARLNSKEAWQYGYIEARIKLPQVLDAIWPAFWMLKQGGPAYVGYGGGEIDIMEWIGTESDSNNFTVHSCRTTVDRYSIVIGGKTYPYWTHTVLSDISDWHCYGVLWTHESITGYIDGVEVLTVPNCVADSPDIYWWPYDSPYYILLNLAIGGDWPGDPSNSFTSATVDIDWVRVFQKP